MRLKCSKLEDETMFSSDSVLAGSTGGDDTSYFDVSDAATRRFVKMASHGKSIEVVPYGTQVFSKSVRETSRCFTDVQHVTLGANDGVHQIGRSTCEVVGDVIVALWTLKVIFFIKSYKSAGVAASALAAICSWVLRT